MPFQLRRGTDAERNANGGIVFLEGELIYVTDTEEIFVGDGVTPGGIRVTGSSLGGSPAALTQNLNMNGYNITGTGNIDIIGTVTADLNGVLVGRVIGDVTGSVFADDSSLMIDGISSRVVGNVNNVSVVTQNLDVIKDGSDIAVSRIFSNTTGGANDLEFNSHRGTFDAPTNLSVGDGILDIVGRGYHSGSYKAMGLVRFRTDPGGSFDNPNVGLPGSILFSVFNNNGGQDLKGTMELTQRGLVVNTFGDYGPESLKVGGDAKITGTLSVSHLTGDVTGSVFADDSSILVDAVNGEIPGYVKIADLKTALQDGAGDYAAFKAWVLANL